MQSAAEVAYPFTDDSTWSEPILTEHASGNCALSTRFDANDKRVSNIVGYNESIHAKYAEST